MRSRRELFWAENGVKLPVSAKNNEMMYRGWCLGIGPFFVRWESKWGLRLVREPLLRGRIGAGVEGSFKLCFSSFAPRQIEQARLRSVWRRLSDLLRKCAWNGVGGVSASGVSALLSSASCVGLKIWQSRPRTRLGKVEASFTLLSLLPRFSKI